MVEGRLKGAILLPGGELPLNVVRLLGALLSLGLSGALLDADLNTVVGLVPVLEGMGIDENDGSLDEGLGTDKLVIGGVVGDIKDTDLAGADLSAPRKVA